jgi:hypothetical protein
LGVGMAKAILAPRMNVANRRIMENIVIMISNIMWSVPRSDGNVGDLEFK